MIQDLYHLWALIWLKEVLLAKPARKRDSQFQTDSEFSVFTYASDKKGMLTFQMVGISPAGCKITQKW